MASRNNFFNRVIKLLADYQFNNNLIDDANGYNLTGTDITYNNGSAVFNGISSQGLFLDSNYNFSFTDGVNDLPFRIETSVKFNSFSGAQFIVAKRDDANIGCEWQILFSNNNEISISLLNSNNTTRILKKCIVNTDVNTIYNIVVDYDGSKTLNGLNISVNGVLGVIGEERGIYIGMQKVSNRFTIGSYRAQRSSVLNGEIDYLKIYK